jgi:hypothetical protein
MGQGATIPRSGHGPLVGSSAREDGMRESDDQFLERIIVEIGPSVQPLAFR